MMSEWFAAVRGRDRGAGRDRREVHRRRRDGRVRRPERARGRPRPRASGGARDSRSARRPEREPRADATGSPWRSAPGSTPARPSRRSTRAPGEAIVTGAAVNAAARLEQLAEPGQTIVAERTARAAPRLPSSTTSANSSCAAGGAGARASCSPARRRTPRRAGCRGMHAPLVGRERELDLLARAAGARRRRAAPAARHDLRRPWHRQEPPRARAARRRSARAARAILVGRCLSYGDGIAYWPLAEILKRLAGISDDDTADARSRAASRRSSPSFSPDPPHAAAALAFTVGLDTGDEEFARLQPSALRVELHRTWRTLLLGARRARAARRRGRRHPLGRPGAPRPARGGRRPRQRPAPPRLPGASRVDRHRAPPGAAAAATSPPSSSARSPRTRRPSSSRTCSTSTASATRRAARSSPAPRATRSSSRRSFAN